MVLHTVGPVLIDDWYDHPNVTAILWAGLPGQESGNSLVDVLYGRVNPGGKTPFTWGRTREDYGAPLVLKPNNGKGAPQQDFTEGIFIDYRRFDKYNITPIYEFGFGLSYTTFEFSELNVQPINTPPYTPASGFTKAAQSFGPSSNASDNLYPSDIERVPLYIYPWLNSTDLKASANDPDYGLPNDKYVPPNATNGNPQPINPAGGAPGGNPSLYEPVARVSAIITNTGKVTGDEVPQLVSVSHWLWRLLC